LKKNKKIKINKNKEKKWKDNLDFWLAWHGFQEDERKKRGRYKNPTTTELLRTKQNVPP
jgi:hypothetical protein